MSDKMGVSRLLTPKIDTEKEAFRKRQELRNAIVNKMTESLPAETKEKVMAVYYEVEKKAQKKNKELNHDYKETMTLIDKTKVCLKQIDYQQKDRSIDVNQYRELNKLLIDENKDAKLMLILTESEYGAISRIIEKLGMKPVIEEYTKGTTLANSKWKQEARWDKEDWGPNGWKLRECDQNTYPKPKELTEYENAITEMNRQASCLAFLTDQKLDEVRTINVKEIKIEPQTDEDKWRNDAEGYAKNLFQAVIGKVSGNKTIEEYLAFIDSQRPKEKTVEQLKKEFMDEWVKKKKTKKPQDIVDYGEKSKLNDILNRYVTKFNKWLSEQEEKDRSSQIAAEASRLVNEFYETQIGKRKQSYEISGEKRQKEEKKPKEKEKKVEKREIIERRISEEKKESTDETVGTGKHVEF